MVTCTNPTVELVLIIQSFRCVAWSHASGFLNVRFFAVVPEGEEGDPGGGPVEVVEEKPAKK